jgi:regulator of replication initiation timing
MHKARSNTHNDFDKVKDALQKLKSENRKLRKENSQLRKELNRAAVSEFERSIDSEEEMVLVPEEKKEDPVCPKCKAEGLLHIKAGRYLIKSCNSCGYRKRLDLLSKK